MLDGLMSLCMMPAEWMYLRAHSIWYLAYQVSDAATITVMMVNTMIMVVITMVMMIMAIVMIVTIVLIIVVGHMNP